MKALRWEKHGENSGIAFSGEMAVGSFVFTIRQKFHWTVDGVNVKDFSRGFGDVATENAAKLAVEKAWSRWIEKADLDLISERERCADIARHYLEALKDCSLNDDEPEKIRRAIISGSLPPDLSGPF